MWNWHTQPDDLYLSPAYRWSVSVSICLCLCAVPVMIEAPERLGIPSWNLNYFIFTGTFWTRILQLFWKGAWPMSWDALNCRMSITNGSETVKDFGMHLNVRNIVHKLCAGIEQKKIQRCMVRILVYWRVTARALYKWEESQKAGYRGWEEMRFKTDSSRQWELGSGSSVVTSSVVVVVVARCYAVCTQAHWGTLPDCIDRLQHTGDGTKTTRPRWVWTLCVTHL